MWTAADADIHNSGSSYISARLRRSCFLNIDEYCQSLCHNDMEKIHHATQAHCGI